MKPLSPHSLRSAATATSPRAAPPGSPDWLALTVRYVGELQYGQVTLTIHQGEVIEVQKTERTRLARGREAG